MHNRLRKTYKVLSAVHLGVDVDNGATALKAIIDTHLSGGGVVHTRGQRGDDGSGVEVSLQLEARIGGVEVVDERLDEGTGSQTVTGSLQVGRLLEDSLLVLVNSENTSGGQTVGHVGGDIQDGASVGGTGALVVASGAVDLVGREEGHAVLALSQETIALGVEADVLAVAAVQDGLVVGDAEVARSLGHDGKDGVILETNTNGEVNPLVLGGDVDAALLDSLYLALGANTRVEQKTGGSKGTGSKHNTAIGSQVNDLGLSRGSLQLDTSHLATRADNANDLGVEAQGELVTLLGKRQVSANGTSTQLILDVPCSVTVDLVLLVGLGDHINGLPANILEELGQNVVQALVVELAVRGGQGGTRVTGVKPLSSRLQVLPFPTLGPVVVVVEVMLGRVHEDHVVDSNTSAKDTSSIANSVSAHVFVPYGKGSNVRRQAGQVNRCEGVVPGEGVVGAGSNCRAGALLEKQHILASLDESLSSDDTRRTTTDDNVVVVSTLECGCSRQGASSRKEGCLAAYS